MDQPAKESSFTSYAAKRYRGRAVYLFAFDIAYELKGEPPDRILGLRADEYAILPTKRSPRQMFFYRPRQIQMAPRTCNTPDGPVEVVIRIKVFGIGAVSIQVSVPFAVDSLTDLIAFHDLKLDSQTLDQHVTDLACRIQTDLGDRCIRPMANLVSEAYTIFCIDELPPSPSGTALSAEKWLNDNVRQVAGLLMEEPDDSRLSSQEAEESTGRFVSYYSSDLAVVDWDAALVVGQSEGLDDILHIAELANVQLSELQSYDRQLDVTLDQSYRDLSGWKVHANRAVLKNLREIHVDMARFTDELENITKFFGDWHLARIYANLSERFHLAEWHRIIDNKLKTLGDLYQLLQHERNNFWMVVLEATIVLLFVLDLLLLFMGKS